MADGKFVAPPRRDATGEKNLPPWFRAFLAVVGRLRRGAFEIELMDGRVFRAEGDEEGDAPAARVVVKDNRLFGRSMREGALGFCEAYLDGWWDTPDLQAVLDVALLNNQEVTHRLCGGPVSRIVNRLRHWLRRNTKAQAPHNIRAHYDLGNDFYQRWLDDTMTYSSALFEREEQSLSEAQTAKYRSICDRMALAPGHHVLEIGCGWGGFAEYAAKERGARVTGLTLSPAQLDFARKRMHENGLSERVDLVLRDYRDERGIYDGVASIEMFEAVGEKYWPVYFQSVRDRLKPGARASLQVITIADHLFGGYRNGVDFIQKHVFPGGMLPSPTALRQQIEQAGLRYESSLEFGQSYSRTLRLWRDRFNDAWGEIRLTEGARPFDAYFYRLWNLYLASCASVFYARTGDVTQVAAVRP